jgi:hypothetical protein
VHTEERIERYVKWEDSPPPYLSSAFVKK